MIGAFPGRRWWRLCLAAVIGTKGLFAVYAASAGELSVFTAQSNKTIRLDTVVIRLDGSILPPLAEQLEEIWAQFGGRFARLLLDLDSPGGQLAEAEAMIKVIASIRKTAAVDTLVRHDAMCGSACVAIFVQGTRRSAGGSSTWLFHGACPHRSNIPNLEQTRAFLSILKDAGVSTEFICRLTDLGISTTPGKLWISGYELFHVYHANVITDLLSAWRPETPSGPEPYLWIEPR